jgi:hypothetical protein
VAREVAGSTAPVESVTVVEMVAEAASVLMVLVAVVTEHPLAQAPPQVYTSNPSTTRELMVDDTPLKCCRLVSGGMDESSNTGK